MHASLNKSVATISSYFCTFIKQLHHIFLPFPRQRLIPGMASEKVAKEFLNEMNEGFLIPCWAFSTL